MPDYQKIIAAVFENEFGRESDIAGAKVENTPNDRGGPTICGVASASWPTWFNGIAAAHGDDRVELLQRFYEENFWKPSRAELAPNNQLAYRIFDFSVNAGTNSAKSAMRYVQAWLNAIFDITLEVDGILGRVETGPAMAVHPSRTLLIHDTFCMAHYQGIVQRDETQRKFLNSWTSRIVKQVEG